GSDESAALGGIDFRDFLEQRIEVDMRDTRVEETIETLDETDDFHAQLTGADDRAVDGGVERGRVASGGEDRDASHVSSNPASLGLLLAGDLGWLGRFEGEKGFKDSG